MIMDKSTGFTVGEYTERQPIQYNSRIEVIITYLDSEFKKAL